MDKRPWLTLAIDVFTRMVVGFYLSMDKPSRVSLGLCMLNAVYDKSAWLTERQIDASWPAAGLPEAVHADNGADCRSHAFAWACREEGIKLIFRPIGAPHYGGHIERLIGTMMGRVHFYPGSTVDLHSNRVCFTLGAKWLRRHAVTGRERETIRSGGAAQLHRETDGPKGFRTSSNFRRFDSPLPHSLHQE